MRLYSHLLVVLIILAQIRTAISNPHDHWAVIVVGSSGYDNYRHSADGCHAYHILRRHGIPPEQIVTIAYGIDLIAHSAENPFRGQLFNRPTEDGVPGEDVYQGCHVDYKFDTANKHTVLRVLQGEATVGHSKVLQSNANSKVFFYFTDHGAPGLLQMSAGNASDARDMFLYADELHAAVRHMYENNMYQKMVLYIEACESGSMFENILEDNLNVYALSASASDESSFGTYCYPNDKVNGKHILSCLGDLFSVSWMENTDTENVNRETLEEQFEIVRTETNTSAVLQWGSLDMKNEIVANFLSAGKGWVDNESKAAIQPTRKKRRDAVNSRDIKLHYLQHAFQEQPTEENWKALETELTHRETIHRVFQQASGSLWEDVEAGLTNPSPNDFDCYRDLIHNFAQHCGVPDTYSLQFFKVFVAQCDVISSGFADQHDIKFAMQRACELEKPSLEEATG